MKKNYEYQGRAVTYIISDDGYDIYLDGVLWITQHEPYIPHKNKSYEENAILQIEELTAEPVYEPTSEDDINLMLTDQEYRLLMLELDV